MIAVVALLAAAVVPANRLDPIEAFRQVCMEGEARFSKAQVAEVQRARLPWNFAYFVQDAGFDRFFVSTDRNTLIAVSKLGEKGQICSVLTEPIDKRRIYELGFPKGADKLPPLYDQNDLERMIESSAGYQIVASRYGRAGLVLTTFILTAEEKKKQLLDMKAADKPVNRMSDGYYRRTRTAAPK